MNVAEMLLIGVLVVAGYIAWRVLTPPLREVRADNFRLDANRVAVVTERHPASLRERWAMWRNLHDLSSDKYGPSTLSWWTLARLHLAYTRTVFQRDCEACWYRIEYQDDASQIEEEP